MNILLYDWEIKSIQPLLGDLPDEHRVKLRTRESEITIFLNEAQIKELTTALAVVYSAQEEVTK